MRRLAILFALIALGAVTVSGAAAGPAAEDGLIHGRVIDVTCYGPCAPWTEPRRFEGEADVVVTKRAASGEEVARVAVEKGRYEVEVAPGRYRVVAIPYPMQASNCWVGERRRVNVEAAEVVRRHLVVENVCVQ